jgi:hypothetical protein
MITDPGSKNARKMSVESHINDHSERKQIFLKQWGAVTKMR